MSSPSSFSIVAVVAAAILGAAGVVAAAGATHSGDQALLGPLSLVALTHAPAILALALAAPATRLFRLTILVLALGALLFVADLACRHFTGHALFSMAAPIGGSALILGWLMLVPAAFTLRR